MLRLRAEIRFSLSVFFEEVVLFLIIVRMNYLLRVP